MPQSSTTAVHLDTDDADIKFNGHPQRLPCEIILETVPSPRLDFTIATPRPSLGGSSTQSLSIHLVRANVTCETFVSCRNDEIITLTATRTPIAIGQSQTLTALHFDLINFPTFWDMSGASAPMQSDWLDLSTDGWNIEIRPPRTSQDVQAFPKPLYPVTHSCAVHKNDGATFTSEEAQLLLNVFHEAFSFAAGQWVAPVFARAADANQQILWKEWGTRPIHPRLNRVETWFDSHHPKSLLKSYLAS